MSLLSSDLLGLIFPDLCDQFFLLFIQEHLMGEDCSVPSLVNSGYLDLHGLTDEFRCILHIAVGQLGKRDESGNFLVLSDHAAVDSSRNFNFKNCFIFMRFNDLIPVGADF